jgi:cytochrome c peroxidase
MSSRLRHLLEPPAILHRSVEVVRRFPLASASASAACAAAVLVASGGPAASAQQAPLVPTYFPYPRDIVPADLDSETARVQKEITGIFNEALAAMKALPAPDLTGQPPTLQGSGYQAVETLGKLMNFDLNISPFRNEACAFCHMPYAGFSGPIPSVNLTMIAYPGSLHDRAGKRTAQRYTYSPDFPVLEHNDTQAAFFGGNFWDGRSTGYLLQSPDAEQAQHPPVDTQEMGFPDTACIAFRLSQAPYRKLFEQIWGRGSFDIDFPGNTEKTGSTPGGAAAFGGSATPVALSPQDRTKANQVYDHWAQSISFYERSNSVSPFTSKFDAFLAGNATLSSDEMAGYNLFKGKANCNSCHLDGRSTTLTSGQTDTGTAADARPLFTCFGYANLGLPVNAADAFYYQTTPDSFGFTPNPLGFAYRDLGLGTFLRSGFGSAPNPNAQWVQFAPASDGQMQTSTARNVAMTPSQCPTTEAPGPYFQKEFFHNGYIKSLKQLVHFYNTRDVFPFNVTSGHCPSGKTEKVDCWPQPEVGNPDMTMGNLQLSDQEENQIVAFLQTLTDGFTTPLPAADTFTGTCQSGGTAATQGNAFIIPAPMPLPACDPSICGVQPLPTNPIP